MRQFVLRGQTRVHMAKESDQRRRTICAAICAASVNATIYDAGQRYRDPLDARSACLQAVISDTTAGEETLIVLEQDDSIINGTASGSSNSRGQKADATTCDTSTAAPKPSCYSQCPTPSPGAGRVEATGDGASSPSSPPLSRSNTSPDARNPARPPSGRLPGSLPEAQRNRHPPLYPRNRGAMKDAHKGLSPQTEVPDRWSCSRVTCTAHTCKHVYLHVRLHVAMLACKEVCYPL